MNTKAKRWIIGSFLILGTMLAGYITADGVRQLYYGNMIWVYREGFFYKLPFVLCGLDFICLTITGMLSCISFFRKGKAWKPLTNIILANIALYFLLWDYKICSFNIFWIGNLIYLPFTAIVFWLLWQLHKLVEKTHNN